jgi:large subunit ribosomal protein L29
VRTRELRERADVELRERLVELRDELFQRQFRSGQDEVEERGRFRKLRREVARIETLLREREKGIRGQGPVGGGREG